jgi:hypothetical protein
MYSRYIATTARSKEATMKKATKFQTTREMVFGITESDRTVSNLTTYPAGTEVYASHFWSNQYDLRVCGTIMTAVASRSAFDTPRTVSA